jgi:hypothetical protein
VTRLEPPLLPPGTRLLHIGPHKTGTSSLQSAFHSARGALARHGVHYAGRNRQPLHAAQVAAARRRASSDPDALRPWHELLQEVRRATAERLVISSEWFSDADDQAIRLLVEDLDPDRIHLVLTVRPLASLLPSQWQQFVQAGMTMAYEPWLRGVLADPPEVTPIFWHRHRHDQLVRRWAAAVGTDRVTVVVADDRDRGAVLRAFETLVGLPPGLLVPEDDRANRSLTRAEIELVRAMNVGLREHGIDGRQRQQFVLFGAAANLKVRSPDRDEPRIETPPWAIPSIARASTAIVDGLASSGVRIVGDLDGLAGPADPSPSDASNVAARPSAPTATTLSDPSWPEVAALANLGLLVAAGLAHRDGRQERWEEPVADPALDGSPEKPAVAAPSLSAATAAAASYATPRLRNIVVARVRHAAAARLAFLWRSGRRPAAHAPGAGRSPIHSARSEVE